MLFQVISTNYIYYIVYIKQITPLEGGVICIRIIYALVRGSRGYTAPISPYEGPYIVSYV